MTFFQIKLQLNKVLSYYLQLNLDIRASARTSRCATRCTSRCGKELLSVVPQRATVLFLAFVPSAKEQCAVPKDRVRSFPLGEKVVRKRWKELKNLKNNSAVFIPSNKGKVGEKSNLFNITENWNWTNIKILQGIHFTY